LSAAVAAAAAVKRARISGGDGRLAWESVRSDTQRVVLN